MLEIINILTTNNTVPTPNKNIFATRDIDITASIVSALYFTLYIPSIFSTSVFICSASSIFVNLTINEAGKISNPSSPSKKYS